MPAPVGMADFETARVQVWVPGHGWVDRTERPDPVELDDAADDCAGAA